jgi:hypothetical protein
MIFTVLPNYLRKNYASTCRKNALAIGFISSDFAPC